MLRTHGMGGLSAYHSPQVDFPNPKKFKGTWSDMNAGNFLWAMVDYFKVTRLKTSVK